MKTIPAWLPGIMVTKEDGILPTKEHFMSTISKSGRYFIRYFSETEWIPVTILHLNSASEGLFMETTCLWPQNFCTGYMMVALVPGLTNTGKPTGHHRCMPGDFYGIWLMRL